MILPRTLLSKPNSQCLGEVFQIYNNLARGCHIAVGDKVALHYIPSGEEASSLDAGRDTASSTFVQGTPLMNMDLLILTSESNAVKYSPFMPTVNKRMNRLWTKMPLCFSSAGIVGCQCRKDWQTQMFVQRKPCHRRNLLMNIVQVRHLKFTSYNGASVNCMQP